MLPGLRLVLVAITATFALVVLGFTQLVKLQVAQSHSAGLAPVEARFAGLAFAERADWTPAVAVHQVSLESLPPFSVVPVRHEPAGESADAGPKDRADERAHLPPPPAEPTPEAGAPEAAVWAMTATPAEVAPETAEAIPVAPAEPQTPVLVASLPDAPAGGTEAAPESESPNNAAPDELVPTPAPRPVAAAFPKQRAQPRPAKKKAARAAPRKRAAPAASAAAPESAGSSNPLSALFGRSSGTSSSRN